MPWVYILKSIKDKRQYIGSTINIERRVRQHNNGYVQSTKSRRPLVLMAYEYFDKIRDAAQWEKRYKRSHDWLLRKIKSGSVKIVGAK